MVTPQQPERKIPQALDAFGLRQERDTAADTMFAITGRALYVIGDIDGRFRPRSNPYDIYAFGHPLPGDPLAEKLQGVWAQPVKGFAGYEFALETSSRRVPLFDAERFTQKITSAEFEFRAGDLRALRVDFVPLDLPVLFTTLVVENTGSEAYEGLLFFSADFDLEDAWFTHLASERNTGETVEAAGDLLLARSEVLPERWAAGAQASQPPASVQVTGSRGEFAFRLALPPGGEARVTVALCVVSEGGAGAVKRFLSAALPRRERLLEEKNECYRQMLERAPRLSTPDSSLNAAFKLALLNLQMLEVDTAGLGRYFYAGLEMFPFWFGGDGAYSLTGLLAAGMAQSALNHGRIGLKRQDGGRIPHQVSPAGHTIFAGSAQETPLWAWSIFEAYRWTGDRNFLAELYPGVVKGVLSYTLGAIDPDGDGYASGPGAVEREDMGEEKLDTAVYTWSALKALVEMARVMQDKKTVSRAEAWIRKIEDHFDADWWDEDGGTYAMSLTAENRRYPVPHWAVITPLEVGLATPAHAARTLETMRSRYISRWGLNHTAGEDERVWTLPTAVLSRAAYRNGDPALGYAMLSRIVECLDHGSIGMLHELIPQGACFIQLWSGAMLIRGVVEDLLGVAVRADRHEVKVTPRLPDGWESARIENLRVGVQVVNIEARADGTSTVEYRGVSV